MPPLNLTIIPSMSQVPDSEPMCLNERVIDEQPRQDRLSFWSVAKNSYFEGRQLFKEYLEKFYQYRRLSSIHYWGERLSTGDAGEYQKAKKYVSRTLTAHDRGLMWQEIVDHYFLTGTVRYLPRENQFMRDVLGQCISANEKEEVNNVKVRAFLPDNCVSPNEMSKRENPLWLLALLSFNPQPIAPDWLNRHVTSLLSSHQIKFKKENNEAITIYDVEVTENNQNYFLNLVFMDGYQLDLGELEKILGWIMAFNSCLPGHEVKEIYFLEEPEAKFKDGSSYVTSYYDSNTNSIYVKIGPVSLDSLTHEFGHALHDNYVAYPNHKVDLLLNRLENIYRDHLSVGALKLIKDSYYNPYNANQDLLRRGHPEDSRSETAASLLSATTHHANPYLQNVFGPDTPREHLIAGILFWEWQQDYIKAICNPKYISNLSALPYTDSFLKIRYNALHLPKVKILESQDYTVSLF